MPTLQAGSSAPGRAQFYLATPTAVLKASGNHPEIFRKYAARDRKTQTTGQKVMAVDVRRIYTLGEFELEPDALRLTRGGAPVHLTRKPFQVLVYLVEHRDRVVSRNELLERFWDGYETNEEALSRCVSTIRTRLGDTEKPARFIETYWGEGYRYVGPLEARLVQPQATLVEAEETRGVRVVVVEEHDSETVPSHEKVGGLPTRVAPPPVPKFGSTRTLATAACLAVIVSAGVFFLLSRPADPARPAPIRSVAVLPLRNTSGDPANEYFSDGMTESLIAALSRIDGLKVISRGSVFRYKGKEADPREAGKQLSVASVLEGSVWKDGERVRVSLQLVETSGGQVVWAGEPFDRPLRDIFALQDDLARKVSAGLRLKLGGGDQLARAGTSNVEAYQLYLRGRYHLDKWTSPDTQKSVEYFQRAITLDPHYAQAYTGLADAYSVLNGLGVAPPTEVMPKAKAAVARALELDDTLAEAYTTRGLIKHFYDWDFAGGDSDFERAIGLNPNSATAHHLYGKNLPNTLRFDKAIEEFTRALELDPYSVGVNKDFGEILYYARQYDRAVAQFQKALELEPNYPTAYFWLARVYSVRGLHEQAVAANQKSLTFHGYKPETVVSMAEAYAASGWAGYLQRWISLRKERAQTSYVEPYRFVELYTALEEKEQALLWLERAYVSRSSWIPTIKYDPRLDALRSDPRFQDLLRRVENTP